jgi:hypothetical protein
MKLLLHTFLFTSVSLVAIGNAPPDIKRFFVAKTLQGEQGVEQIVARGVAEDAEDGPKVDYRYRIVSGGGALEPVKRYAIYHPENPGNVVFELTVTDSAGATAKATAEYMVGGSDSKRLYTDKATWVAALTPKSRKQAAFQFVERDPNLPNVLLIGDSISIGYTPYVQKELAGKCNVYRIPENGGDSKKALAQFETWMGDSNWDVIHFNTGLHDMKRTVDNTLDIKGENVNSPKEYGNNLEEYFQRLETTGAKLIWASTTAVPEGAEGRIKGEEVQYNQVAGKVRRKHPSIGLNDLYTLTEQHPDDQKPANVHFEETGKEQQGKQVAGHILEVLK